MADATQAQVAADLATALTSAKAAEKLANEELTARLTDIISGLAASTDGRHDAHNYSVAALEVAVVDLERQKADATTVTADILTARGKLPTEGELTACTAVTRGQLRYNAASDLVEYCSATKAFKPVSFSAPGSSAFTPGESCQAIYDGGYASGSGIYWIKQEGYATSSEHFCVMPLNDKDAAIDLGGSGKRTEDAAHSCRTAFEKFGSLSSSVYYIQTVDGPVQTYCDMERNGGGT